MMRCGTPLRFLYAVNFIQQAPKSQDLAARQLGSQAALANSMYCNVAPRREILGGHTRQRWGTVYGTVYVYVTAYFTGWRWKRAWYTVDD